MKTILISMAAATTLAAAAVPAAAQVADRFDNLQRRLVVAERTGQVEGWVANRIRNQLRDARQLERRVYRDGRLEVWERRALDNTYVAISGQLSHVREPRVYGYGYGDRYDGYRGDDYRYGDDRF